MKWHSILPLLFFVLSFFTTTAYAQAIPSTIKAPARSKIIDAENAKPGTTDWIITKVIREKDEP